MFIVVQGGGRGKGGGGGCYGIQIFMESVEGRDKLILNVDKQT